MQPAEAGSREKSTKMRVDTPTIRSKNKIWVCIQRSRETLPLPINMRVVGKAIPDHTMFAYLPGVRSPRDIAEFI